MHFKWWVLPIIITILVFLLTWWKQPQIHDIHDDDYIPDATGRLLRMILWSLALAISLSSWLIWALMR